MFLVNWFSGVLSWLGMGNKKAKILFLGLDNAGKTTLLHMLKEKKVAQLEPTQHPHDEELTMGKIKFRCVRAQGAQCARGALRHEGARKRRQSARGGIYGCVRATPDCNGASALLLACPLPVGAVERTHA
jgi:GTPase SAR1 family protein